MYIPFILLLVCRVRPPSAILLRSKSSCILPDVLLLRSLLSASVFTNAPRSGITLFVDLLLVKDDLTLTEGRVVCCLLGASCLGGPGILPELRFSSENINSSQIRLHILI